MIQLYFLNNTTFALRDQSPVPEDRIFFVLCLYLHEVALLPPTIWIDPLKILDPE